MYAYGRKVAQELLNNKDNIKKAILYREFNDKKIVSMLKRLNIKIEVKDKIQLDKLVDGNHQGIILVIDDYQYYTLESLLESISNSKPLLLILDHLEDPHNLGAIIRTAEASGVDGIIIPKDRSVGVTSTVIKTSMGASNYVPIARVLNLNTTINELKKKGYWIIGADMDGDNYKKLDYNMPIGLVIGNEGKGLSRLVKDSCDYIVSIPMKGKINSLNASVATGVLIYEMTNNK